MKKLAFLFVSSALFFVVTLSARADLTGTQVTASGNEFSGTQTIPSEFTNINIAIGLASANFSSGQDLVVSYDSCVPGIFCTNGAALSDTFTDSAFTGATLSFLSNGLDLSASITGDVLTISSSASSSSVDASSHILITTAAPATPEPGTLVLLGTGLLGFAGIVRRRLHS